MSDTVTIGTDTATIYGTAAGASSYLAFTLGDAAAAWRALSADDSSRSLVTATRYLDGLAWSTGYTTFALRDAVTVIVNASYELAALVAEDPAVLTGGGEDVASYSGGGVSVTFAGAGQRRGPLPAAIRKMVRAYLATPTKIGGYGQTGNADSDFAADASYTRDEST